MKIENFTICSEIDQLNLAVTVMIPQKPTGIIQFVHGMSEYRKRYFKVMEFFTSKGFITIIHDHRGHGESLRAKDDLGYFYQKGKQGLVEDTHQITSYIKTRFPSLPCFLLGHSMGSLVARIYLQQYDHELDGMILIGAPNNNKMAALGRRLVHFLSFFSGKHHRSTFIDQIAFHGSNRQFQDEHDPNSWLCSDPVVREKYQQDPLSGFLFTLDGFDGLFELMKSCFQEKNYKLNNKDLPIYFLGGADDPIIGGEKGIRSSVDFLKTLGYTNVQSQLYCGKRHELLNETNKEIVYETIYQWISEQQKQEI